MMLVREQLNSIQRQYVNGIIWFNLIGLFTLQYAFVQDLGWFATSLVLFFILICAGIGYILTIFVLSLISIKNQVMMHFMCLIIFWLWYLGGLSIYIAIGLVSLES